MSKFFGGRARRKALLGPKLDRDTANTPQTGAYALYNIINGRVILTSIVGQVTAETESGANNFKLVANPTTGTSKDICNTLDTSGDGVGTLYGITGEMGTALIGGEEGATNILSTPVVLQIGTLDFDTSASKTGKVKWSATYIPLDDGAEMTVA